MVPPRLHEIFDRRLALAPDTPLLFPPGETLSVGAMVGDLETGLRGGVVVPGDRVPIRAEDCPEHIALNIGCNRTGPWSCGNSARRAVAEIAGFVPHGAERRKLLRRLETVGIGRGRSIIAIFERS